MVQQRNNLCSQAIATQEERYCYRFSLSERESWMRNTGTLEEKELTENEPQQDTQEPAQPEIQKQEVTALVPTEPDVIEGEVVEIEPLADLTPPKQKPYWLLIPLTILLCLSFLGVSLLLPLFSPSAIVTLVPVEQSLSAITAIQVRGRSLALLTLSQSTSVSATGKRRQDATRAVGTVTLYNGSFSMQTIAAGTILTGRDRVAVITDQAAVIPAGNTPTYGQVTVSAHAVLASSQGNIPAYDINTACCATSVLAKNTQPFIHGAAARNYTVVTRENIQNAELPLKAILSQIEHAALLAQLHSGEALMALLCTPSASSDHRSGDEAKQVSVTVSETCSGITFAAQALQQNAAQLITMQVTTTLGANYSLIGAIQVNVIHATVFNAHQGLVRLVVQISGIWAYQITLSTQQHFLHLIAGKPKTTAIYNLLSVPGIRRVQITTKGGNQTLPEDSRRITIVVLYMD